MGSRSLCAGNCVGPCAISLILSSIGLSHTCLTSVLHRKWNLSALIQRIGLYSWSEHCVSDKKKRVNSETDYD